AEKERRRADAQYRQRCDAEVDRRVATQGGHDPQSDPEDGGHDPGDGAEDERRLQMSDYQSSYRHVGPERLPQVALSQLPDEPHELLRHALVEPELLAHCLYYRDVRVDTCIPPGRVAGQRAHEEEDEDHDAEHGWHRLQESLEDEPRHLAAQYPATRLLCSKAWSEPQPTSWGPTTIELSSAPRSVLTRRLRCGRRWCCRARPSHR